MPAVLPDITVQAIADKAADLNVKIAGNLAIATVHLFTNDFNPTAYSVVGDYIEAAYVGYAAQAVAGWTDPDFQLDGSVTVQADNVMPFVGPVGGAGPTIYGYFIKSAGGGTPLIAGTRFAAPYGLLDNTDVLNLVATYREP